MGRIRGRRDRLPSEADAHTFRSAIALYAWHPMSSDTGEPRLARGCPKKRRRTEVSVPTVGGLVPSAGTTTLLIERVLMRVLKAPVLCMSVRGPLTERRKSWNYLQSYMSSCRPVGRNSSSVPSRRFTQCQ
jgi:hypothetical protein